MINTVMARIRELELERDLLVVAVDEAGNSNPKDAQFALDEWDQGAAGEELATLRAHVRTKLPKPGELRDRAILGGEPSL